MYCWCFRNPVNSPVEAGSLSHYLQGFKNQSQVVGLGISEPSTVSYIWNLMCKTLMCFRNVGKNSGAGTKATRTTTTAGGKLWGGNKAKEIGGLGGGFKILLFWKWSNLTNIFQMGWNHQLVVGVSKFSLVDFAWKLIQISFCCLPWKKKMQFPRWEDDLLKAERNCEQLGR